MTRWLSLARAPLRWIPGQRDEDAEPTAQDEAIAQDESTAQDQPGPTDESVEAVELAEDPGATTSDLHESERLTSETSEGRDAMAEITMPQLGETVTEGTITKWFKQVGEQVAEDEVLFEVSTDKVDSEVPSPVAGYVQEIRAPEGSTVGVGEVLAVVGDAPADGGAAPAAPEATQAEEQTAEAPAAGQTAEAPLAEAPPAEAPPAAPEQSSPAAPAAPAAEAPAPQGPAAPAPAEPATGGNGSSSGNAGRLLSPVVRRLIEDNGLDPAQIQGTGVGGRITRGDVLNALDAGAARGAAPAAAPAAAAPAPAAPAPVRAAAPQPRSGTGDTVEPLNNIRRRTGEYMVASKATSPHAITAIEVDYEAIERARKPFREQFKAEEGFSLTYLPFVSRAVVDALREFPHINASVHENDLVVHNYVNLAIAVDLDYSGLVAPVIPGADDMRLRAIARGIHDLAGRARSKKLSPDDIVGGTFTISNSGSYGTLFVIPIINQPQVAILSTDGVKRRPVVVTDSSGNEAMAIHSVGNLTMSWDHRAFDGAYAAAFLARVKEIMETRDWAAEL